MANAAQFTHARECADGKIENWAGVTENDAEQERGGDKKARRIERLGKSIAAQLTVRGSH